MTVAARDTICLVKGNAPINDSSNVVLVVLLLKIRSREQNHPSFVSEELVK